MIRVNVIDKSYNKKNIIKNLNLEFEDNKKYLLKGRNGLGKTTLLNILALIDTNYIGNITYTDINCKDMKNKEDFRYNNISYIPQNMMLFENLTVLENIEILLTDYDKSLYKDLLEGFRLRKKVNVKYKNLSGGQKQKVNLLFGILQNKKVLILDEPSNNLDKKSKLFLDEYLKKINNKTIIVVEHSLNDIEGFVTIMLENHVQNDTKKAIKLEKDKNDQRLENNKKKQFYLGGKKLLKIHFSNFSVYKYNYMISIFIIFCLTLLISSSIMGYSDSKKKLDLNINSNDILLSNELNGQYCSEQKEECLSSKMYFSSEDIDNIKKSYEINEVDKFNRNIEMIIPIRNNEEIISYDLLLDNLDLSMIDDNSLLKEYANSLSTGNNIRVKITSTSLLNSSQIYDSSPFFLQDYNYKSMILGEYPKDNSENEVMIDETLATYLMQEKNLESLEQVIGLELKMPTKKVYWNGTNYEILEEDSKPVTIHVVGIYESIDKYKSNVIYGYNEQDLVLQKIKETEANLELKKERLNKERERFDYEPLDENTLNELFGSGIKNIYIEFETVEERKVFENYFEKTYPTLTVYTNEKVLQNDSMRESKEKINKLIKLNILLVGISLILFILINKGSNILLLQEGRILNLVGLNKKNTVKYLLYNQLIVLLISSIICLPLILKFHIITCTIVIVFMLIINLINVIINYPNFKKFFN